MTVTPSERSISHRPPVLAIGGSDSSAGAGVQADLQAITANGGYPLTALTAVTAQHGGGVRASFPLPLEVIEAQLAAACEGFHPVGVKTGMLVDAARVQSVASAITALRPRVLVVDPVMRSSSGFPLLDADGSRALRERLLPLADVVTPNVPEAEALSGMAIRTLEDAIMAGRALLRLGVRAVVVTGGHLASAPATDVLVTANEVHTFAGTYVAGYDVHGTGCVYASAIATRLACGDPLATAVGAAQAYVATLIRTALAFGTGARFGDHLAARSRIESEVLR